jgi:hypothetical protein
MFHTECGTPPSHDMQSENYIYCVATDDDDASQKNARLYAIPCVVLECPSCGRDGTVDNPFEIESRL